MEYGSTFQNKETGEDAAVVVEPLIYCPWCGVKLPSDLFSEWRKIVRYYMNWKEQLKKLEDNKNWNTAIEFMQKVIEENPDSLDAYLSMNYLLMNLLVEEDHDESKHDYYVELAKKYFKESYAKFSNNPEYLFFTAMTASMSEWYFGIEEDTMVKNMMMKALELKPNNILYQWGYFFFSAINIGNSEKFIDISKKILKDSSIVDFLKSKVALGECVLGLITSRSKRRPEDFK